MGAFKRAAEPWQGLWEIEGRILMETPFAILLDDGVIRAWLPKRFAKREALKDGKVAVFIPEWLAREKKYI